MWQEEDVNLLVTYSAKPPTPVYTRRKIEPLGPPSAASAGGKKKLGRENLGAMFPHGETWLIWTQSNHLIFFKSLGQAIISLLFSWLIFTVHSWPNTYSKVHVSMLCK